VKTCRYVKGSRSTSASVSAKSASVSPGKPTMKSPDSAMSRPHVPMCVPVRTISGWCSARRRASRQSSSTERLRFAPRAIVVAQNVQCSSHPSWIRSTARTVSCRVVPVSAGTPSARATPATSAPDSTSVTVGSARSAGWLASSAEAHPMTIVRRPGRSRAAPRTALRRSRSASAVTAHELNTATSASAAASTTSRPPASAIARTVSLS